MEEKKKNYEAPQMKVHQVKSASIICTSTRATQNEEYETENPTWTWN